MNQLEETKQTLQIRRLIIPLLLSVATACIILFFFTDRHVFSQINWLSTHLIFWFALAGALVLARALGYVWRLRELTNHKLSWHKAFQVIMLWEFASTVTPGVVGGSAVAIFLLNKEQYSFGKSTAMVLLATIFDNLILVIALPVLFIVLKKKLFYVSDVCHANFEMLSPLITDSLSLFIILVYLLFICITVFLAYGVLVNPRPLGRMFTFLSTIKWLKRWKESLLQSADEITMASREFQSKKRPFWRNMAVSTVVTWIARFLIPVFLLVGISTELPDVFLAFGRQFTIWIIMMLPSTPGAAGVSESVFMTYMCEFMNAEVLTIIWRMFTYYLYFIIGIFVLPRWLERVLKKGKAHQ